MESGIEETLNDDEEQREKFHSFVEEAGELNQLVNSLKEPSKRDVQHIYDRISSIVSPISQSFFPKNID